MRADLDRLMQARDLQALLVAGGEHANAPRRYLSNGIDIHGGIVVKVRGQAPVLIVSSMEIEEAARSGLTVMTTDDFKWFELFRQAEGDYAKAYTALYSAILTHFAIPPGRIGLYGTGDLHVWLELRRLLESALPDHPLVGEIGRSLFDEAALTKDAEELRIIREVAAQTQEVLEATWDFIAGHRAAGELVVDSEGRPLTIGAVKRFVNRALLDRGLEGADMIFAQGRDAGFPHSRGQNDAPLKLGEPIIFDLFPRQIGGGYYHDCTRTWCIGYAPEAVQRLYDQVAEAFRVALLNYAEPGQPTHEMQDAVQDYFEAQGHPTRRSQPNSGIGYAHSLGHGIGLNVHERPSISHLVKDDRFEVGNVITIEPGLYYPDQGLGVRLEDTFVIEPDGSLLSLTPFRQDLVLPLRG